MLVKKTMNITIPSWRGSKGCIVAVPLKDKLPTPRKTRIALIAHCAILVARDVTCVVREALKAGSIAA